jgi:dipeptidyl aminopeptidase/acylaminoacyl peptidase
MHALIQRTLFVPFAVLTACGGTGLDEARAPATPMTEADVELIPREALLGNPERVRGRISPDGATVSFLSEVDGVLNIWVAPADDIDAATAITADTLRGIRIYNWAADGEHIVYLQDQGGDENWQVHSVVVATAEDTNLTPLEGVQARIVATSWNYPKEILVGLNDRDEEWHDVYRVNIETGDRQLVQRNEGMASYVADKDLNLRLAVESTPDGGSVLHRKTSQNDWEVFLTIPPDDFLTTWFNVVAANGTTAYGVDSRGRNTGALVALDVPSAEVTVLGVDDKADVSQVLTDTRTGEALAYATNYTRTEWFALDDELEEDIRVINSQLGGEIQIVDQTENNNRWVVHADEPNAPGRYYLFDRNDRSLHLLFGSRPVLDGYQLATATDHVIPARDGLQLVSYLTIPVWSDPDGDGVPTEPMPMALLVHGGPWSRDGYSFDSVAQWLANRGYAVLQVNFRGSRGFGKAFLNAGDLEWAAGMHDDLIDAVDWAVAGGIAREDEIAIMGASYGGYATLVGLTFTPDKFAAGVDVVGPSNLETLLNSIPPYWTAYFEAFARRVGDPRTEEGKKLLADRSPLFKADQIVRPLLIGQGANDPRVKQAESDQIVEAMTTKRLPVTYVLYSDEGHGFARPENSLSFFGVMEAFLATHLGGRYEALTPEDLEGSSISVPTGADLVPGLAGALAVAEIGTQEEPAASTP